MKESELKMDRHKRPIQKSELVINRLYQPIQSEDRIRIGRLINRTFRPPLPATHRRTEKENQLAEVDGRSRIKLLQESLVL